MNILNILYTLLIEPIKLVLETIYSFSYLLTSSFGLSIVIMSFVMNFLLLPLYNKADAIQSEENEAEKKLKYGVDHIKKTFKGDERYMITQTYYRQNNYKPVYSLRGLLPLMLEVPFFIAAYDFLSNLNAINGVSFGPIDNLGVPDGLLFGYNLLPTIMTLINVVSSYIFAKDSPLKTKIQLFVMAAFFLVLLYDSPSGLVVYWTLNNVFSLIKNIIIRINNYKYKLSIALGVFGAIGIVFLLVNPLSTIVKELFGIIMLLCLQMPFIIHVLRSRNIIINKREKPSYLIFIFATCFLSVLVGLLIPSSVINSSPSEFVDFIYLVNPSIYIFNSFLLALGIFVVWFNIYYSLMSSNVKHIFCFVLTVCCAIGIINYMFFGNDFGLMNNSLVFDDGLIIQKKEMIINLCVVLLVAIVIYAIWLIKKSVFKYVLIPFLLTMCVLSFLNIKNINTVSNEYIQSLKDNDTNNISIELSKNNKNVVVLLLDRAIGAYFPFLLEEKPQLQEQFAGFTYYPNTISYACYTYMGARVVYGGYEYTPEEIVKRIDETIAKTNDEALQVLPNLFLNNDYDVYVNDVPYAGNEFVSKSIYDARIHDYALTGKFMSEEYASEDSYLKKLNRNLVCYSIMKISPLFIENYLYNDGYYNNIEEYITRFADNIHVRTGIDQGFVANYTVLTNLNNFIDVSDKTNGSLVILYNNTAHEDTLLQEPDYIPANKVNNTEYDAEHSVRYSINGEGICFENKRQAQHYQVNMAAALQVGKWLDYLRENDVYDNTRIIIVADHGASKYFGQFDNMVHNVGNSNVDASMYNPILLFKDFNSNELVTDNRFMTNAEVPILATNGLIENDINPFTGNDISEYPKSHLIMEDTNLLSSDEWNTIPSSVWLEVNDNIFDAKNWSRIKD